MITTLTGNNTYVLHARLNELIGKFIKENGELALERLDAADADPQAILEAAGSLPFLAKRKMLVVRDLSQNKLATDQIEQIISSTGDSVDLIFYEPSIDKRTIYYKVLKKLTEFEEHNNLDLRGLARWLVQEAKKMQAELSQDDAVYLVERVGESQMLLGHELEKLGIFNPQISRKTIDLLVEPTPQSKVFDLLDAAFGGNKTRALALYEQQRAQKVEPQEILSLIAWQLRLITLAHTGKGRTSNEIATDAGLSPYPVGKAQKLASKLSDNKLRQMVNEAYQIDQLSKTKSIELDEALKTYLTTI